MSRAFRIERALKDIQGELFDLPIPDKSRTVCLVDAKWHKALKNWINGISVLPPTQFSNASLMLNNTLNPDIKYGKDFEIIEESAWDLITKIFGKTPKITRYYSRFPNTNDPVVILDPVRLSIDVEGYKVIKKTVDKKWKFGPVIDLLCTALELNEKEYNLLIPDGTMRISRNVSIYRVVDKYPGILKFYKKQTVIESNQNEQVNQDTTMRRRKRQSTSNEQTPTTNVVKNDCFNKQENQNININYENEKENAVSSIVKKSREDQGSPLRQQFFVTPSSMFPYPVGLRNLGNTCFFNAAMQCLFRVQKLTDFIVSDAFESQINENNPAGSGGKIAFAYRDFLLDLCKTKSTLAKNPKDLRAAIVSKYKRFANYGQHDSQELLGAVLDGLHEDLNQARAAKGKLPPSPTKKGDDSWKMHIAKNSSPIMDIFHGELISSITCPLCKHADSVHDPFLFLSIPVAKKRIGNVQLIDCINDFAEKEVLDKDNMWLCPYCNKRVQATKTLNVYRCAPVLIIHLKRFSPYSYQKISTCVEYPSIIDSKDFAISGQSGKYKLIGAVFHHGSLYGGHYTSAAWSQNTNKWYHYDDSFAEEISEREAHSASAYILFYQLI